MLEKDFQKEVIRLAHMFGWRVAHFRTAMNGRGHYMTPVAADGAGFPDLCMVKGRRLLFVELKAGKNTLSEKQVEWIQALQVVEGDGTGLVEVYVWTAGKTDPEEILRVLKGPGTSTPESETGHVFDSATSSTRAPAGRG